MKSLALQATVLTILVFAEQGLAQTCPGAPATHDYDPGPGQLIVLEGPAFGGTGLFSTGMNASVAIDDPAEGPPRFLIAWESDAEVLSQIVSANRIYLSRFEIDGDCIVDAGGSGPRHVSGYYEDTHPPISEFTSLHHFPSLR